MPLVIFHDKEAAHYVLAKKAQKTSARPQLIFAGLAGFENFLITHQYDDKYRQHRKMVHQEIGTKGLAAEFQPIQEEESIYFMLRIFKDPDNLRVYLKTFAAAVILKIMYGYAIERNGADPLVELIEHAMGNLSQAFVPLSWIVDTVPAIKYLPDWFPGTSYRKTAQKYKAVNEAASELPYSWVKLQLALNTHRPSYVSNLLQQELAKSEKGPDLAPEVEQAIKWTAVSLYAADSDSTVAILQSVILAFLIFPEVVQKAQEEINRVVGTDRLPTFEDQKSLPYVDGIVKESWRWNPVGPMGLMDKSVEDIVHGEYLIPKGSYSFLHDPEDYSDPDVFKPERYLAALNEPDPSELASCAGRFFADTSVYIVVAQMLAVFQISKAKDAHGNGVSVKLEAVVGMVNRPKPYQFKIQPRSARHVALLRILDAKQEPAVGDSSLLNTSTR
ncbi:MAG: hypothetical protein Q9222_001818 [Ikaeria aurantiellina]